MIGSVGKVAACGRSFDFAFGSHSGGVYFSSSVRVVPSPAAPELPYRGEPFREWLESLVIGMVRHQPQKLQGTYEAD